MIFIFHYFLGIENVEFICAKAEDDVFEQKLNAIGSSSRIVVIVDPPRSGLRKFKL